MKNKSFIYVCAAMLSLGFSGPLILVGMFLFNTGCKPKPQQIAEMQAENQKNINNPMLVATAPQGKLYLIFIRPYPMNGDHYDRVYFFDTNATVTVNAEVRQGKQFVSETSVLVNGKK